MLCSIAHTIQLGLGYSFVALFLTWPTVVLAGRPIHQFGHIFPAWEPFIRESLAGKCSNDYTAYLNTTIQESRVSYNLIGCLIDNIPEYRKAEMATSALVLGLTPFIIQQMGPRLADISTLALRRPILALLIAGSCPIVSADMAGTWSNPIAHLKRPAEKTMRLGLKDEDEAAPPRTILLVAAVEYLVVMASFVNIQILLWQLSTWAVLSYSPSTDFQVWLWAYLVLLIHAGHIWSVLLRFRIRKPEYSAPSAADHSTTSMTTTTLGVSGTEEEGDTTTTTLEKFFSNEIKPLAYAAPIELEPRPHGYSYFLLGYLVSAGAAAHVLFGTLVLSSLIFISLRDSVGIVWRFGASTILCRIVLGFEITGAREQVSGVKQTPGHNVGRGWSGERDENAYSG